METELEELKMRLATLDGTFCKEERARGNGGCGLCPICCRELSAENERLRFELVKEKNLTRYLLGETIYTLVQNELAANEMHQEIFDRLCSTLHEPWNELSDEQIECISKIIPERLPRAILYMGELNERLKEQEARHRGEIKAIEYETEEYKKLCVEMIQTFQSIIEVLKDLEVSGRPIQVRKEALERLEKMTLEAVEPHHGVLAGRKK